MSLIEAVEAAHIDAHAGGPQAETGGRDGKRVQHARRPDQPGDQQGRRSDDEEVADQYDGNEERAEAGSQSVVSECGR